LAAEREDGHRGSRIVGLLLQSDFKQHHAMAEGRRMTAADAVDKLMASEHADVIRESVAVMVGEWIETESGRARPVEPPTEGQGARRVWSDSEGRLWVSEWNAGKLAAYDPRTNRWREWRLPGANPQPSRYTSTISTSSG
jgi:streptogramin lyase